MPTNIQKSIKDKQTTAGNSSKKNSDALIKSAQESQDKSSEKFKFLVQGEKRTSIYYPMEVYLTLTDLKKFGIININDYVNDVVKKDLEKNYNDRLQYNTKMLKTMK